MDIVRINRSLRLCPPARQEGRQAQAGFTLVEIMVVITIVGILATISMPAFASWRNRTAVSSAATSLLAHMKQARTKAMAENRSVSIAFTSTTYTFDADTTGSCGLCKSQTVSFSSFSSTLSVSPTTTRTFSSQGTANSGTITLTANGVSRTITLNVIGRAYLQ